MNNTILTRRFFLGGFSAVSGAAALGGCSALPILSAVAGAPRLKLGVLSDVHIKNPGDEDTFRKTLEFFRERRVDGVLLAGDFADTGRIFQAKILADTWFSVFPEGKHPDGKKCEQLFVYGNHCMTAWSWGGLKADSPEALADGIGVGDNPSRTWRECFHEEYAPVWIKKINGCTIIGAHWESWNHPGWSLKEFLEKHRAEIDPSAPLVYTQHDHPGDTVMGPWAWGNDHGRSTAVLKDYPNAVVFSGHSHYPLTDERSVWQEEFTSINTSSLKYSSLDYSLRENTLGNGWGYRGDVMKHPSKNITTGDGRQAMVVSFFADRLEIERREFVYGGRSLGPDWIVPWPARRDPSMTFAARAARRSAPMFAADAELKAEILGEGGKRKVSLVVPPAESVDGCRPYEYEITATLLADDLELVQLQRRGMVEGFHLPAELAHKPTEFLFDLSELPLKGRYRFSVRPIECFGRKGGPIAAELDLS